MATIENRLHEHFSTLQEDDDAKVTLSTGSSRPLSIQTEYRSLDEPFAKVNSVVPGSPAEGAGLRPGDEIRNFGYVNHSNHDSLKKVAECVQGNEGVSGSPPGLV